MNEFEWGIIRELLIYFFLRTKENRSYLLFLFLLRRYFQWILLNLLDARLVVCKMKQNKCKCRVFLGKHTTPLTKLAASSMQLRSKKTQTSLKVFFVRSFSVIFCLFSSVLQNGYIVFQLCNERRRYIK